jgi:hypothetical protein
VRVDLYGLIHKAQRFHLSNVLIRLGQTDASDEPAMARLGTELRGLVEHLRDHAHNEHTYIHPLFERLGGVAALERDHLDLEADLAALEHLISSRDWQPLYGRVATFFGEYLLHLDEEETAQRTTLWPNYRDEELAAVFLRFKAERAPEAARADLEFMRPALNPSEAAGVPARDE